MDPTADPVIVRRIRDVLFVTLNRPATRNALAPDVVAGLVGAIGRAEDDPAVRALVLRGAGGFFCAGGNVGGFREQLAPRAASGAAGHEASRSDAPDPMTTINRAFGHFMTRFARLPVPVVAVVEGGAYGGGFGLACAADVVLATRDAGFALSETSLGLIAAQIAPFVVARIGAAPTRRLGLTGERVAGERALALGLVDECADDAAALDERVAAWLTNIGRCAPRANRAFKSLVGDCGERPLADVLDDAARQFARCLRDEGSEGTAAFRAKRPAAWVVAFDADDVRAGCAAA